MPGTGPNEVKGYRVRHIGSYWLGKPSSFGDASGSLKVSTGISHIVQLNVSMSHCIEEITSSWDAQKGIAVLESPSLHPTRSEAP